MKRVYSGLLEVETETRPNLAAMFSYFEENLENSSYIVGWLDAFAKGDSLGRGDVHKATYLPPGLRLPDPNFLAGDWWLEDVQIGTFTLPQTRVIAGTPAEGGVGR